MNTSLTVRLIADTSYIPVMYRVVEMTVGATAAATYCVLSVVRVGWDTVGNYDNWTATKNYDINSGTTTLVGRTKAGMQGTLGALSVAALSLLTQYAPIQTPSVDQ